MRASAIKRILKRAPKGGKFHRTLDILRVIAQVHNNWIYTYIVDCMCDVHSRNGVLNLPRRSQSPTKPIAAPPAVVK